MPVRLALFGSPSLEHDGGSVALPLERRNQLLVFLALRRSWVGRAELAALLWPEQESGRAYANLRKTLFRLQALPWAAPIEAQGGAIRFDADTDVHAFDAALREGRIADALRLRRGELLAGFDDDGNEAWSNWLGFERERLRAAWRDAALEHLTRDVDPGAAIDLSARLLDADPLDEAALRAHMAWLARGGQSARARQTYRDFVRRIDTELGIAPSADLKALHDSLGAPVAAPATTATTATALPAEEGFIGRTVELNRIADLLARGDCRLLCLIGPGGVGKTRLAQRALQELAAGYAGGTAFIPLEDITSAAELGGQLARELGVALTGGSDPFDQVIEFLRERQMLLVLDNFEQLVPAAPALDRLLNACPRLKIVVTSRVRLASSLEWLLPIEGLPCPEMEDQDRIESFDAARLFIRAARRVEPALLPAVEAASIVDICRQVEGLPLALELAAAWTRVLSCEAIAAELRHGSELLSAVDASRPARHASFEVVFEQSWRLLGAAERDALAKLSVFRGGFSSEAALAVARAQLPVLGALADKSLLRKEGTRLSLHPLVHQLAAARFGDGAERDATETAHARYFHRLLVQLRSAVKRGDRDALALVETDFENCRLAWRQSAARDTGAALLASSALTLLHFCDHRGRFEEGLALMRAALASRIAGADTRLGALLQAAVAHLEYRLDRYPDAEASAMRALAAARAARDQDARLHGLRVMGACCLRVGRYREAKRNFTQALHQAQAMTEPASAAAMLDNLALVENALGNYDEALRLSRQSLVQHQRLGDSAGEALCLNNLGMLQMDRGDFDTARVHLTTGLALCERHGLVSTRGLVLANLTELAMKTGDDGAAQGHGTRALEVAAATRNRHLECWLKLQFARLAIRRGDLDAARADLRASLEISTAIGRPALIHGGLSCFAELLDAQGARDCARQVLRYVAGHPLTGAPERDEYLAQLQRWGTASEALPAWPGIEFDELVQRVSVETGVAHAPLIADLRRIR